ADRLGRPGRMVVPEADEPVRPRWIVGEVPAVPLEAARRREGVVRLVEPEIAAGRTAEDGERREEEAEGEEEVEPGAARAGRRRGALRRCGVCRAGQRGGG